MKSHGATGTPEFNAWQSMRQRCRNPRNRSWSNYGGRGITVCDRWRDSFETFLADMGPRPSADHSIDRIDNDGPYSPDNCRWATRVEQGRNRRTSVALTHAGETMTISEWADRLDITPTALATRLRVWGAEVALTTTEKTHVRGERHKLAKLTDLQADEVIRRRLAGETLAVLAAEFGISTSRVSKMALTRRRKDA